MQALRRLQRGILWRTILVYQNGHTAICGLVEGRAANAVLPGSRSWNSVVANTALDGQTPWNGNSQARGFASVPRRRPRPKNEPDLAAAPLKNEQIRVDQVRLVFPDDESRTTEVVSRAAALEEARLRDLDLVLVSAGARPPVARIADYDKILYEMRKKAKVAAKQQREQQKLADPKEVRVGSKAAPNDLELKLAKAKEFLEAGQHMRLSVTFKGPREAREARTVILDILGHLEGLAHLKDLKHLEKPSRNQWAVQLAPLSAKGPDTSILSQLEKAEAAYLEAQARRAAAFRAQQQQQRKQPDAGSRAGSYRR